MPNTEIHYMYRDGFNYKQGAYVVVEGYDKGLIKRIEATLDEGSYFLVEEVELPSARNSWDMHYEEADHVWHEWVDAEPTDQKPTDPRTLLQLTEAFEAAREWVMDRALEALETFFADTREGK